MDVITVESKAFKELEAKIDIPADSRPPIPVILGHLS